MIQEWFDAHVQYVLVDGHEQYQVLLDDQDDPTNMWSTILLSEGSLVNCGDGLMRQITGSRSVSYGFTSIREYSLRPA